MVVVEVRQGTLGVDGRGWGPAENTVDRGSQLSKDDEDDEEEEERRTRQEEAEEEKEEEKEEKEEEEEATDIKSNNPHLAGGEQRQKNLSSMQYGWWFMSWLAAANTMRLQVFLRAQRIKGTNSQQ